MSFSICQLETPSFVPLKYFALNFIFHDINTALLKVFGIFDRLFFQPFLLFVLIPFESPNLLTHLLNPLTFIVICDRIKSFFIFSILFVFPFLTLFCRKKLFLFHFSLSGL